jgi:hypothetical protein
MDLLLAMARSDAEFDGRTFDALGRADKRRYLERSLASLKAALQTLGEEDVRSFREVVAVALFDVGVLDEIDKLVGPRL